MIQKLKYFLKLYGVLGLIREIARRVFKPSLKCYSTVEQFIFDKAGLEIGGPSKVFSRGGMLPLYSIAGSLDNCNFCSTTVWEGAIQTGNTFIFDPLRTPGKQYILEITDLKPIKDDFYDFVISSHALEHTSNPLKALVEMRRVLKAGGILILVLPHKDGTFDHRRPVSTIEHLKDDFINNMPEDDLTHLQEILSCHDLNRDPWTGDIETFTARSKCNIENRCLHHHVFDTKLAVEVMNWLELQIIEVELALPHHIFVVAQKADSSQQVQNNIFMNDEAQYLRNSPFTSDHTHSQMTA